MTREELERNRREFLSQFIRTSSSPVGETLTKLHGLRMGFGHNDIFGYDRMPDFTDDLSMDLLEWIDPTSDSNDPFISPS